MKTDVFSVRLTATNTAVASPTRVMGVFLAPTGSGGAGSLILKDGGASGTVRIQLDTVTAATSPVYMRLPGAGVRFNTDVHATIANLTGVTIFYG